MSGKLMAQNGPASNHNFFSFSDPVIKKLYIGVDDFWVVLEEILVQFNEAFLDLKIAALKFCDFFGFLLIGRLFVLELFPELGNEFL